MKNEDKGLVKGKGAGNLMRKPAPSTLKGKGKGLSCTK
jgi:hypothetical protein